MKKILTSSVAGTVGQPFLAPSLEFLQTGNKEIFDAQIKALLGSYTANDVVILYGCVISGGGPYAVTAGAIYYNGETYLVDVNASITVPGGQTLVWKITQAFDGTIDPVTFSDLSSHSVHQISKIALQAGASGSGIADYIASTVKNYDTGWIALTNQNGWTNTSAAYRKIGNVVYLRGKFTASGDETNATMATLPVGARPAITQQFPSIYFAQTSPSFTGISFIIIPSSGTINENNTISGFVLGTSTGDIYLDGISFPV